MAIDARQLQARGVYETRASLGTLFQDLDQIEKLFEEITAFRKKIRLVGALSALAGLAFAIAGSNLRSTALAFCAILAFVFFVVLLIYSFIYGRKLLKHRDRLAVFRDLAKSLQHDADLRSPFSVMLALASQAKLVREEAWLARKNGKERFFEETFLSLAGELVDGTALTETVTEFTRKRTYKNPRGKVKTKTRSRYLATVRFAYPNDVYGDAQPASAALNEEILLPAFATLRDTRVTDKAIVVKALVTRKEDVAQTCAMMSLGAYRILNLARRVAAGGPGGKP